MRGGGGLSIIAVGFSRRIKKDPNSAGFSPNDETVVFPYRGGVPEGRGGFHPERGGNGHGGFDDKSGYVP